MKTEHLTINWARWRWKQRKEFWTLVWRKVRFWREMRFVRWHEELKAEAARRGVPEIGNVSREDWRDFFEDGETPSYAIDTELSYWAD